MATYSEKYKETLDFIDNYWNLLIHDSTDTQGDPHNIPLPNTFIAPNSKDKMHWKNCMFYWDTFFMFRGLIDTERSWVIPEATDNLIYLFNTFGIIPNASVWAFLGHSQPPFLTSMIFDSYYAIQKNSGVVEYGKGPYIKHWLKNHMEVAKKEYQHVWEDSKDYTHKIEKFGLSRYGDRDVGYALTSERESGWDFTTRYYNRCNDFLPVDLNSFLHKYEKDFAKTANILGDKKEEEYWEQKASERHARVKKYMWNEEKGFFFDYDFSHELQSEFYSLAGFVPLWAKLATYDEAKRAREKLPLFETQYGLTITAEQSHLKDAKFDHIPEAFRISIEELMEPKQWDYPHIWPPVEYLAVIGLLRYGFIDDATRIMKKSVEANNNVYKKYGALLEKLDARTGEKPKDFWYPSQLGFGWTNAIFYRYVKILDFIDEKDGKIYSQDSLDQGAPYSLTGLLH
jgi:alpha,alpha-trehalase